MKKKAFITGISGQDGANLTNYLLEKDYDVYGIVRRHSLSESQDKRLEKIVDQIHLEYGDVCDYVSMQRIIKLIQPNEIYNLAAQSHVKVSFEIPTYTINANVMGIVNLLEIVRTECQNARLYQASSSEMFGNCFDEDGFQRETTPMHPVSPYGCSKLFGYSLMRNYRHSYKIWAANGILFNHTGIFRGLNFVEQKIVKTAIEIKKGLKEKLILGNLYAYRDFGSSKDYVKAMHAILQHSEPDDFVIATGKTYSIKDICDYVFNKLQLPLEKHLKCDQKYFRPEELKYLKGDSSKAKKILNWEPTYTFEQILDEMIEFWEKTI